ncbi:MAG: CPXCG motif-containing cysteine-rich protein [Acidobacteriota bacterium]
MLDDDLGYADDGLAQVTCPHCFETLELVVDPTDLGTMVQDCEVCCHPWQMHVSRDADGRVHVSIEPLGQ